MIGYTKSLFFLPFDHRSTFTKGLFPDKSALTDGEKDQIKRIKLIIYEGLKKSIEKGLPKEFAAVLVDEQFGTDVLKDAAREGIVIAQTVEKSGQDEFDFEYGQDFGDHLLTYHPTFAKALVRFNPDGDSELNTRQLQKLKTLADFCHSNDIKLLIEPLIPPTDTQLSSVEGDKSRYDRELRPDLEVRMIKAFQEAGVEVDIWKIEGFEKKEDYEKVVAQARSGDRHDVGVIILGRGGTEELVSKWLQEGSGVEGVTGFAVGRTVFWDPVMEFFKGRIDGYRAAETIADNFLKFYHLFTHTS